ncbi:MAG: helix-hairpin-helix domain-containing protein [Smithellaceae bacterium]
MVIFERQVRGIIALCLILAVIPLSLFYLKNIKPVFIPSFLNQTSDTRIIEVISNRSYEAGVYFISQDIPDAQFLKHMRPDLPTEKNLHLKSMTAVIFTEDQPLPKIVTSKMSASRRLVLGFPLDINTVSAEELMMVSGIGEVTAAKIIEYRAKNGSFSHLSQLMKIKGIKQKTYAKIAGSLCVDPL